MMEEEEVKEIKEKEETGGRGELDGGGRRGGG